MRKPLPTRSARVLRKESTGAGRIASRSRSKATERSQLTEFICSRAICQLFKLRPKARCSAAREIFWLQQWRLDLLNETGKEFEILATNSATLYTFILSVHKPADAGDLMDAFWIRLSLILASSETSIEMQRPTPLFTTGNPRSLVGSMNDMKRMISAMEEEDGVEDEEDELNETPFSMLNFAFPKGLFFRRLRG